MSRRSAPSTVVLSSVVIASACQPAAGDLPWVTGLDHAKVSSELSAGRVPDDEQLCPQPFAFDRIELEAELTAAPGLELLTASYAGGVQLRDRRGTLLGTLPGASCTGSRDSARALAVGEVGGQRTIVVAIVSGGRTERATQLEVIRPGPAGELRLVFSGVVEQVRGEDVEVGSVTLLPGRLVHRAPNGDAAVWRFDDRTRVFVIEAFDPAEHVPES